MTHPEWADHDTAELGRCQTVLADGMHAGLIALDRWHEDLLTDLEAEVTARHTAGGRPRFGRWDA